MLIECAVAVRAGQDCYTKMSGAVQGPFVRSFNKALGVMNVHRQAYYGGNLMAIMCTSLKVSKYN